MAKRKWPDHTGVGRTITVDGVQVSVVDVRPGKPFFYTGEMDLSAEHGPQIRGSLELRIKYPGGAEKWLPPVCGESFCKWCDEQDAKSKESAA